MTAVQIAQEKGHKAILELFNVERARNRHP
jgi:hypothetical protein